MSNKDISRRTAIEAVFDGTNITESLRPYLISLTYTDSEEDDGDDLQIKLHDRDGIWKSSWLPSAVNAAASERLHISASIVRENWNGDGYDILLPCGTFELDSVDAWGPPDTVTIKATALPYSSTIRQTKKSKAWEAYNLSGIAAEMAAANGLRLMYESGEDPYYDRVEQVRTSDIAFLQKLCKQAGISLKATDGMLVLFDQKKYEGKKSILTIKRGDGTYSKYKLAIGTADTEYTSCRVSYTNPKTGKCISGRATVEDYNEKSKNNQQLEIKAKVSSIGEAKRLAAKKLREHNKYERTITMDMPGRPSMVAGITLNISGFGFWDGKYIVSEAKHTVDSSGYKTSVKMRCVLEGY